ncbi:MAG TPA: type II toxin-antitoxin system HicB family antitoxin [Steroidobacteraceae bacterium]|nr:type II toxin-antitoxin system HicB family antitoxin [Steroidobacteraceae bacterium]
MKFTLAIHEHKGKFGVTVPDLPGCFSAGESFDEALEGARDAIDGHVELLIERGEGLPEARSIDDHRANRGFARAIWAVIEVPVERYFGPAEKINITVPALTLRRIDAHAAQRGVPRSRFLVEAAEAAMRKPD